MREKTWITRISWGSESRPRTCTTRSATVTNASGRYAYIADLLGLAKELDIGWAWWTWAGGNDGGWSHGSSEVVFRWPNGTIMVDEAVLDTMEPFWRRRLAG